MCPVPDYGAGILTTYDGEIVMAQPTESTFPRDFALWLREGVIAARILNKFMLAASPQGTRPIEQPPVVHKEEVTLLRAIRDDAAETGHQSLNVMDEVINMLAPDKPYPSITKQHVRMLGMVLSAYGLRSNRYGTVKDQLLQFAQPYDGRTDTLVESFMNGVWRSLGPAVAPDESMIKGAP